MQALRYSFPKLHRCHARSMFIRVLHFLFYPAFSAFSNSMFTRVNPPMNTEKAKKFSHAAKIGKLLIAVVTLIGCSKEIKVPAPVPKVTYPKPVELPPFFNPDVKDNFRCINT